MEPGPLPSEASFPSAGSKAFCPWTSGYSRLWNCDLRHCWGLWKEGLLQPDHWQVSLLQDDVEPCCIVPCKREFITYSRSCNLSLSVSVSPGADAGRRKERSGNSMLFFQGLISCLFLAHNLSLLFSCSCLASELI